MKALLLIIAVCATASCGQQPMTTGEHPMKDASRSYNEVCINGVVYYHFGWSLAPKIDHDHLQPVGC